MHDLVADAQCGLSTTRGTAEQRKAFLVHQRDFLPLLCLLNPLVALQAGGLRPPNRILHFHGVNGECCCGRGRDIDLQLDVQIDDFGSKCDYWI